MMKIISLVVLLFVSCTHAADKTKKIDKKICQRSGKGTKQRQVKALNNIIKNPEIISPKNFSKIDEYFELQVSPKSAK